MSEDLKALAQKEYRTHAARFFSETFESKTHVTAVFADITRTPAKVRVVTADREYGELESFGFLEDVKREVKSAKARISGIITKAADLISSGEYKSIQGRDDLFEYSAQETVSDFGFLGLAPEIGLESYNNFADAQKRKGNEELLKTIDKISFSKVEANRLRKVFAGFPNAKFHKDTTDAVGSLHSYDWTALKFYGADDEKGLLRRQAATVYPLLANFFAQNSMFSRHVIEKKQPLNAELAKKFGVKEKAMKRLQKASWPSHGLSAAEVVKFACSVPPDWFPKNREDWDSFCIICKTIGRTIGAELEAVAPNAFEVLLKGSKGQWREFHKRCVVAFMDDRPPEGFTPEFEQALKETVNWKSVSKAAKKGEPEFDKQVAIELSKLEFKSEQEKEIVQDWMRSQNFPDMSETFMQVAVDSTMDMVHYVQDHVVVPAAATGALKKGIVDEIYISLHQRTETKLTALKLLMMPDPANPGSGKTAPNIFENTRYFLNDFNAIHNKITGDTPSVVSLDGIQEGHWVPLFDGQVETPNGMYFECLTNPKELDQEGKNGLNKDGTAGLSHCVGGYANNCRKSFQHIISLRKKIEITDPQTGFKASTFERQATLNYNSFKGLTTESALADSFDPTFDERQFYGKGNSAATPEMREAKDWLEMSIKAGSIKANWDLVAEFVAQNGDVTKIGVVQRICQYDWKDEDNITNAMFAVGRLVHKGVTKDVRSVSDLIDHEVMQSSVNSMDPLSRLNAPSMAM